MVSLLLLAWLLVSTQQLLLATVCDAAPTVQLSLDLRTSSPSSVISIPISGGFSGLSLEWCNPSNFMGATTSSLHQSFFSIMPYLSTRQNVGPNLRIGGSSSDRSWYNPLGLPNPNWSDFVHSITDDDLRVLAYASKTLQSPLKLGVSFRNAFNMSISGPLVDAIDRIIGWQNVTLEIGNEQEIMDACGSHPYETYRPCGWGWDNFTVEYDWVMRNITARVHNAPERLFQGGAFCCPDFQSRIADWSIPRLAQFNSISFHRYLNNGCGDYTTVDGLMSDASSLAGLMKPLSKNITYASVISHVHAASKGKLVAINLDEGNSVGCQGQFNVTDTFAQSLWLLDYSLALASLNVSQFAMYVGWTNPQDFKATPFYYPNPKQDKLVVQSSMYGFFAFAFATWAHPTLVQHDRNASADAELVKTWTMLDDRGNLVLVVINKDWRATSPTNVSIGITVSGEPSRFASALIQLRAPSITSKQGISFAGLTWDDQSDGIPVLMNPLSHGVEVETVETVHSRHSHSNEAPNDTILTTSVIVAPASASILIIPLSADASKSLSERVDSLLQYKSNKPAQVVEA